MMKILKNSVMLSRLFWVAILVVVWQMVCLSGKFSPLVLPPPRAVFVELIKSIASGEVLKMTAFSVLLIFVGLAISVILAFVLCVLAYCDARFESFVSALCALLHPVPAVALIPIIIIWFGAGVWGIVAVIIHSCTWPLVLNISAGFKSAPEIYTFVGRNLSLNKFQIIVDILIPSSFAQILSGLKIAWARGLRALIAAEMIFGAAGGVGGIGWFIFKQRVFMNTSGIFSGLIVVMFLGIFVEDVLFKQIERRTILKWGVESAGGVCE